MQRWRGVPPRAGGMGDSMISATYVNRAASEAASRMRRGVSPALAVRCVSAAWGVPARALCVALAKRRARK